MTINVVKSFAKDPEWTIVEANLITPVHQSHLVFLRDIGLNGLLAHR